VWNYASIDGGNIVQSGAIHGDVNIYTGLEFSKQHELPIIVSVYTHSLRRVLVSEAPKLFLPMSGSTEIKVLIEGEASMRSSCKRSDPWSSIAAHPAAGSTACTPCHRCTSGFVVDFDAEHPKAVPYRSRFLDTKFAREFGHGLPNFPFTVTASDPEQFVFTPLSEFDEVEWRLELDWICQGKEGVATIPNREVSRSTPS